MAEFLNFRRKPNPELGRGWNPGRIAFVAVLVVVALVLIAKMNDYGVIKASVYTVFLVVGGLIIAGIILKKANV
jgi:hypothetical protein